MRKRVHAVGGGVAHEDGGWVMARSVSTRHGLPRPRAGVGGEPPACVALAGVVHRAPRWPRRERSGAAGVG